MNEEDDLDQFFLCYQGNTPPQVFAELTYSANVYNSKEECETEAIAIRARNV